MTVTFFSLHHHHSFPPLSSTTLSHRHHHHRKTIVTKSCLKKPPSIFLPHLQEQKQVKPTPQKDEPIITDPIHKFFKSQTSNQNPEKDPHTEGKFTLQKNRRTSWHLAKPDPDDDFDPGTKPTKEFEQSSVFHGVLEKNEESLVKFGPDPGGETGSGAKPRKEFERSSVFNGVLEKNGESLVKFGPDSGGETGSGAKPRKEFEQRCVDGVIEFARNLAENVTLGEVLGGYEGKLSERECVEVLSLMGEEEGLVMCCLYFFEWMSLHEPSLVTPWAYSALFPVLGRAGLGDKLLILFDNLPDSVEYKQVHVFNSAISALSDCGRYDDAWSIFETMEQCNVEPDHVTCSIMITIMRRKGNSAKDAWEFFEILNMRGLKWGLEVMGALIKAFCDEGLKKEALIIQLEMEKKGIASNAIIYNTIINAYSKSDQIEEAEGLFAEMKSKGITPTTASYNILMDAYSRRMQPEVIEKLMVEMEELGLQPDVKSFTCLISAYGRQKKMSDMAADAFLKMKKFGIKPTSHSYTALIHAYSISGWHEKADVAFQNMLREGVKPSIETYTALLDAFRRAGDTEALMRIWKRMITDKVEGTRVTFNILVDGFAKQGQYSEARDVICEFGRIGLQPTVMTYNMLINAYARGGQESKLPQLLKEMTVLNLKPDSITYSTMIYAFVRVRDFKRAFYYHKQMVKSGQVPDAKSYHKLRSILDVKAATKNKKDKSAIMGIISSKLGWVKIKKKAKKDEFWKNKKKWSRTRGSDSAASRS